MLRPEQKDGFDHVDGHRTVAFVISPYTKRRTVVSGLYNQTSMLRSMELILGLSPMTQFDAMAPAMWDVFTDKPDLTPYTARPAQVALDEVNPPRSALSGNALYWVERSMEQNLTKVDAIDEDTMNRILWYAMKGEHLPYPEEFTGPAGRRARQR